ncbi:prolyl oligopeptidase family serine peptidase [Rhodanobacter glycinis]|uniref:Prolyl oligopeptidase family serine peptidase n=1 Tax=Rhodanobacter glycinis TaxID=582702 RepID=A0A5B9E1L5_9GAMM|nr:DPP IV N-terminal domain-containing protein [Rhodanobacter glycinis]QEE24410.1 prolyl oligopeptidase family serine peptidase [Rhodanobacter glycinis]
MHTRYRGLTTDQPSNPTWLVNGYQFTYRRTIASAATGAVTEPFSDDHADPARYQFVLVDAKTRQQRPAFDHKRLAQALIKAMKRGHIKADQISAYHLPFDAVHFSKDGEKLSFNSHNIHWICALSDYQCKAGRHLHEGDKDYQETGHYNFDQTPGPGAGLADAVKSPDGQWKAYVQGNNLVVIPAAGGRQITLSTDGSEDDYYANATLRWSPDSTKIAIYRIRPGFQRKVHYIESSPDDQLQPRVLSQVYPKPGDPLPIYQPVMFDVAPAQEHVINNALFPNEFALSDLDWWPDSKAFTFEYNQRGHQVYRLIEVDAASAKTRTLINETSNTFIDYADLSDDQHASGQYYRHDLLKAHEILWGSERDGREHIYLYDARSGKLIRKVTTGDYVVRAVDRVDEKKKEIYFRASAINANEDPYYMQAYKIGFDGRGLTSLSPEPADHTKISYSPDGRYFVDIFSRYNLAPVMNLRNSADGSLLMTVARTDISRLLRAGWQQPIEFHAKGRDGKTDIWGLIHPPMSLQPGKHYPVVEDIYAGPQGSFVPKAFTTRSEPLTALGFTVAQIDGMGTANRTRAFHNVAWRNLKDAGFPDRILWHKAAAKAYPWYDISKGVGIFGTSSGGQSAMGALLFHPDFYTVAVANSGSQDNRMDKLWWNEQWMGWPVGPWYAASSNVVNAWRLQGKLMLVVGELDMNVDPSSTFQVVNQLEKAHKDFRLLYVPGGHHGAGGEYGERRLLDFFVRNLRGLSTPDWNSGDAKAMVSHVETTQH